MGMFVLLTILSCVEITASDGELSGMDIFDED